MSVFAYRGRTPAGVITGELEADDRKGVVAQLRSKGVVATAVEERKPRAGAMAGLRRRAGKGKDKSAMVYPLTIISVAILVIIFMMTFVIPTFAQVFAGLGAELPLPTKIVLWMSEFTRRYVFLILAAIVAFVFGLRAYYRTDGGSMLIDRFMLKVPVAGALVQKVAVAR